MKGGVLRCEVLALAKGARTTDFAIEVVMIANISLKNDVAIVFLSLTGAVLANKVYVLSDGRP